VAKKSTAGVVGSPTGTIAPQPLVVTASVFATVTPSAPVIESEYKKLVPSVTSAAIALPKVVLAVLREEPVGDPAELN
jgi:hypothetical protein